MASPVRRGLLAVVLVVTALALELTVLARLPLPGGTPDLLLLVVVTFGLVHGPVTGMFVGFGAGLALDLVPPSDGPVGLGRWCSASWATSPGWPAPRPTARPWRRS